MSSESFGYYLSRDYIFSLGTRVIDAIRRAIGK